MPKILKEFDFNIPKYQTKFYSKMPTGGQCPKKCKDCIALKDEKCTGCYNLCPVIKCRGVDCVRCVQFCSRADEKVKSHLEILDGLDIDLCEANDIPWDIPTTTYIPAINKPLVSETNYPCVSIPMYAIYDFLSEKPICLDVRDYFNLSNNTKILINFYFKDDKIGYLFKKIQENTFFNLLNTWKNIDLWHTPCFSVFSSTSGMDALINFKKQFWIGDRMRERGFNVIQEILYTQNPKAIGANRDALIEIIKIKKLKKIGQCCQLMEWGADVILDEDMPLIKKLPKDTWFLQTGLSVGKFDFYYQSRRNMAFANYHCQFKYRKNWETEVNRINNSYRRN
jgi:hypothetical protein